VNLVTHVVGIDKSVSGITTGFVLIVFAAACGGAFAVPIKLRKRFELENLYVISSAITMLIIPLVIAPFYLPHWRDAIAGAGSAIVSRGLIFGFAWGLGAITFGYSISMVGLSLGYAIIMGINTAVGSILPFLAQSQRSPLRPSALVVLLGMLTCILGVAICGWAGRLRELPAENTLVEEAGKRIAADGRPRSAASRRFGVGLVMCLISGVLSACANLGFAFTSQVGVAAQHLGASPVISGLGSWMLVYWGGFAATLLWFGGLQVQKGTWRNNFGSGAFHDLGLALGMGTFWFLAMIPYGMGAYYLGKLGTSVGWAINIAASLIIANILGFFTGEWTTSSGSSRRVLYTGLAVLLLAMVLLAEGNSMTAEKGDVSNAQTNLAQEHLCSADLKGPIDLELVLGFTGVETTTLGVCL
jgi:L-rhamnose-H+ transport protein